MTEENKEQQNGENIKVLRTYTSDMADVIRNNEISAIKIAVAEKERKEQEELYRVPEVTNKSKLILMTGGIILIIGGIIASYFLINNSKNKEVPIIQDNIQKEAVIYYESSSVVDITNINNVDDFAQLIKNEKVNKDNSIKVMLFTKKIGESTNQIDASEFLSLIEATAPEELTRSLSADYLIGKYSNTNNVSNKDSLFIILKTTDYNQAYASMLKWEKTLEDDISKITDNSNSLEKSWKDVVINNKDARVLYAQDGTEILCYVFMNKKDFIITEDTGTMKEIMNRILVKNR